MSKTRLFLRYWLPVLIWMLAIFTASTDAGSFQHSSRILEPILRWLFPRITQDTVNQIVVVVRKCAHLTEYGMLGILFWRAMHRPARQDPRPWRWSEAGCAVLLVALYAASDEFHQLFVPSRGASVDDVLIDTIGGTAGLLVLWAVGRWRNWWTSAGKQEP